VLNTDCKSKKWPDESRGGDEMSYDTTYHFSRFTIHDTY
jgi:hypothetical protein